MPVSKRSQNTSQFTPTDLNQTEAAMTEEKEPRLSDLMQAVKKGIGETQSKLKSIEDSIAANQKVVEDYIKSNDKVVKELQGKVEKLESTVQTLEAIVTTLSDDMENLRKANEATTKKIEELGKAGKQQDEDKRKANLIIEGLKKDKNDQPRQQVKGLLAEIGVTIRMESILTASRLGPVNVNSRRPRHVLVRFISPFWKQEVFRNISKAKDNANWAGVHMQDDLPQDVIEQRRLADC